MGAIAARLADVAIFTSDNPRSEDPLAILTAMLDGAIDVPPAQRTHVIVEPDRAAAIALAVRAARRGDVVVVAGEMRQTARDRGTGRVVFLRRAGRPHCAAPL